jgi:hypothetical protein
MPGQPVVTGSAAVPMDRGLAQVLSSACYAWIRSPAGGSFTLSGALRNHRPGSRGTECFRA